MKVFGLNPDSILARVASVTERPRVPTFRQSLFIGGLGFGLVSVVAFAIWALAGRRLAGAFGEGGMYAACATAYIGFAGLVFGQLVVGPGGTARIYGLFSTAFAAYAAVWCAAWFGLAGRGGFGNGTLFAEFMGSLFGSSVMAWVLAAGFGAQRQFLRLAAVLFGLNALGYFLGEVWWRWLREDAGRVLGGYLGREQRQMIAMLGWGLLYGCFFGIGIGYVIFAAQNAVRSHFEHPTAPKPEP